MTYDETITKAEKIGAAHGTNAAGWYCQQMTAENYRGTLEGIDAGDPMTMDGFPSSPLSGEWADSYSLADLASDLDTSKDTDAWDDYCRAYEDGFYRASTDEIERVCRYQLA